MKKVMIYALLTLLVIIVIIVLVSLSNPLRKPQEEIRENILALTPIGMSMEDVLKVTEQNKEWETLYVNYERGVSSAELGYTVPVRGEKSIRVMIGKYHFDPYFDKDILNAIVCTFFKRTVEVFWAFDEDSKLIEIYVTKSTSSF